MDKLLKSIYALLFCVVTLSLAGCGDKDEPNDPSLPESGTWSINEYEDLSIRTDNGTPSGQNWTFWENEFKKEINGRKIKITKNTPVEDGWYILSKDEGKDHIGYRHDLEKVMPISVEGKTMIASYYLKQYLSVQTDEDYIVWRATLKLTRK